MMCSGPRHLFLYTKNSALVTHSCIQLQMIFRAQRSFQTSGDAYIADPSLSHTPASPLLATASPRRATDVAFICISVCLHRSC